MVAAPGTECAPARSRGWPPGMRLAWRAGGHRRCRIPEIRSNDPAVPAMTAAADARRGRPFARAAFACALSAVSLRDFDVSPRVFAAIFTRVSI
ncbi:protein of unknown function [Burkholderia multivorans]